MQSTPQSTAGRRQFEQTAVAKLVAEGVPRHVACAFVQIGIPKSGRYESLKDAVCPMQYEKLFLERSSADYKDPMRVGAFSPFVEESKMKRFHAEFAMSDIDAAKFVRAFPEFDVVARGKQFNPHGYYANKRYAECELLLTIIGQHAFSYGLDRRSLIDLGGNASWHAKRNRTYVRCNNPVLSPRDVARYKVREIYSMEAADQVSTMTFQSDPYKAVYGMAVHSTYDMTPKQIAESMRKKSMSYFVGVINVIPGVSYKPDGRYEDDGLVMDLVTGKDNNRTFTCGFVHDPSLQYSHSASTISEYMRVSRRFDFVDPKGEIDSYTYSIHSFRGNSLVFHIKKGSDGYYKSDAKWTAPTRKVYYLSLKFLGLDRMEVDAEMFDRLVLQAAGARNLETYDIVSLFRYAKSLRQRVSVNGIVLSSGYTMKPDQLMYTVVAAYCIAASYRIESAAYFKKATTQIINVRGQGLIRDVFRLAGRTALNTLLLLPAALSKVTGASAMSSVIEKAIKNSSAVTVQLDKPHSLMGARFVKEMFVKSGSAKVGGYMSMGAPPSVYMALMATTVRCENRPVRFLSRGLVAYDGFELPRETKNLKSVALDVGSNLIPGTEQYRDKVYSLALWRFAGTRYVFNPVVAPNGDRIYRRFIRSAQDDVDLNRDGAQFVGDPLNYFVFRGVGKHAAILTKPAMYKKGNCVLFVLFYEKSEYQDQPGEITGDVEPTERVFELDNNELGYSVEESGTVVSDWEEVPQVAPATFRPRTRSEADAFVTDALDRGQFYMSGALPPEVLPDVLTPAPSVASGNAVSSATFGEGLSRPTSRDTQNSEPQPPDVQTAPPVDTLYEESENVSSSDIVFGKDSMLETIQWAEKSEQIALASSRQIVDLALAVANGLAPQTRWGSTMQGVPGNPILVKVEDGLVKDFFTDKDVEHMAVSDGDVVYDRVTNPPPDGIYVTSDIMRVYVGAGIKQSIISVVEDPYECEVVAVKGVAGCGKTKAIVDGAMPGDVVLCETSGAMKDTATELAAKSGWRGHNYTVDSFLMHRHVSRAETLWIDEAFKLHSGKIYAAIKLLKPKVTYCYGDTHQIPPLPFIPDFDFVHLNMAFSRTVIMRETYRNPADIAMAMSLPEFYGFPVVTHNPILRSVKGLIQYEPKMFLQKPPNVVVLTFTQNAKDDLIKEGVTNVMTIGQSQGKTIDDAIMFREKDLKKALYYNKEYNLVGFTRVRRTLVCVEASAIATSDSMMAKVCYYLRDKASELLLASHLAVGVKGVADAMEFRLSVERKKIRAKASVDMGSSSGETWEEVGDWADDET